MSFEGYHVKEEEDKIIALMEECSALIKNKLPPELKDLGSFSIPCTIGHLHFSNVLCDLGASVSLMPLSVAWRLRFKRSKLPISRYNWRAGRLHIH